MRTRNHILQLAATLALLVATAMPSWGYYSDWNYSKTGTAGGKGGSYTFRYDSKETKGESTTSRFMGLTCNNALDAETYNIYYLDWSAKFNYGSIDNNNTTELTISVEYGNGSISWVADYKLTGQQAPSKIGGSDNILVTHMDGNGWVRIRYQPGETDFRNGLRRIYFTAYTQWPGNSRNMQYDIDVDDSAFGKMHPTDYTAEYDGEGNVLFTVSGAPDVTGHDYIESQYVQADFRYNNVGNDYDRRFTLDQSVKVSGSGTHDNKYAVRTPVRSYTAPLRVNYIYHGIKMKSGQKYQDMTIMPYTYKHDYLSTVINVKPYTRPVTVSAEFDRWTKKTVVKWTRNEKIWDYVSGNVDCLFDGTWYVLRYEQGQPPSTYAVVGEVGGNSTNLKMEDTDIEYDQKYVYRVVFLPKILKDKFADKLTALPGQGSSHTSYDLYEETTVSTAFDLPIQLAQDRTYETAVRLVWNYAVPVSGLSWNVDRRTTGETTWTRLDNLPLDNQETSATFSTDGSVCDMVDYRITTTVNGKEFASNIIKANLPAGSYISGVKASTGTEEKTVVVKWTVARADKTSDIYYRVLRRPIGETEWTLLTDEIHGTLSEYTYIDERVMAGSYYEYTVEAYDAKCEEQLVLVDEKVTPGFSQARGTITGHISYGTGTAVGGARINLVKSSADEDTDQPQFLSRYIDGKGKGLQWTADSARFAGVINGSKPLTLQFWARPQSTSAGGASQQTIVRLRNAIEIGAADNGVDGFMLYAMTPGTTATTFPTLTFSDTDFTHVAAVYDGKGQWTFYVGTDTLIAATLTTATTAWQSVDGTPAATLTFGGSGESGQAFSGCVDDVRLWSRALSADDIAANYTRIQGGTEQGLFLYWPLDEGIGITRYAFDVARQDGIYQLNHPEVGVGAQPSAAVPRLLGLYGVTDQEGDYIIRGIPFQQGGTNYKLMPELGIHEFAPNTRSMFISPTSLTANNIDFEDVSSFPMQGYVYYAGTNVPAEGIQLYVDGNLQSQDGKIVQTDAKGYYQMSVPIGQHYVEAKLDGHTMVGDGRFPLQGRFNFERAMTYDFADSTLVNFVGRVGGGTQCDTLAVGFGATKNNIGTATITLQLNNESLSFNCQDDHISAATQQRSWASDTTAIRSTAWTEAGNNSKYIKIQTDPQTGEFSALLPPLKYITKSIKIDSEKSNIVFSTLGEVDLTTVSKELTDSICMRTENGDSLWRYYKYNTKLVTTHFAKPEVALWQIGSTGGFGEREMKRYPVTTADTIDITNIWTKNTDGTINYTYDFPVFARKKQYKFGVRAYEVYTNYDSGSAVNDTVALNGQVLTIANEMSDEQDVVARVIDPSVTDLQPGDIYNLKHNQLRLDSIGRNEITFTTGVPNITSPYTRQFSIIFNRNNRVYEGPVLNGVVLGELTNGNNFVTDGPEHVDMVLRDPPGAKGKTTWKTGTSYTKIDSSTEGVYWDETIAWDLIWGADLKTSIGLGVAIISGNKATTTANIGEKGSFSWLWKDDETYVYTTAENIATSTGSKYVGANGDIFIGKSHNYIIGTCRKLGFHREADGIVLGLRDAVSINDSIKTDFVYSALEIKETMIPKIIDTRNALLEYSDSVKAVAYKNTTDQDVYLTWLTPDDPRYGQEGTYVWKPNQGGRTQNMVLHYNESARLWRERLAENEQDKVEAMNGTDYFKENRSFDGGSSYSYSERRDTTLTSTYTVNKKIGVIAEAKHEFSLNSAATFGTNIILKTELGYTKTTVEGDSLDNVKSYAEFDYEFNDGNPGTDFTVDIYHSPRGWSDLFVLRGGQSYNPFEDIEYAQYYQPEKKHIISYGTERMEQPSIRISSDGGIPATSATLTDIPAGSTGQFTLHLTNNTTTNQVTPFVYQLVVQEYTNQQGLQLFMDGQPLNGRSIYVPEGDTVKKVITVRQTDQSVLDYRDIEIRFTSQYQPIKIYDACKLNVYFKPSSSPVDLVITEPVLNRDNATGVLDMTLTNFDRQFKNLKNVGVQYRFAGNTQWTDLHTWVTNRSDSTGISYSMLPSTGDLRLKANMSDDNSYPDGNYEFRAFTTTPYGTELVKVYSDVTNVVKDMLLPRSLTTPSPQNGILGYGDDLAIEFSEDIVPGYVGDKNVIVTTRLNEQPVNHEVALRLDPYGNSARTVNPVFLNGKDFSIDFWLTWSEPGIILQLGENSNTFALGIDDGGHLMATVAGLNYTSFNTLPRDTWTYFVVSFKTDQLTFSALAQYGDTSVMLFDKQQVEVPLGYDIDYTDDNYLYIDCGTMSGAMHSLSLFNIYRDPHEAAATKYQEKDGYVYGLTNYWPMNEGHGTTAADARHTHDFEVRDEWMLNNVNYCLDIQSKEGMTIGIADRNTSRGDSYAIELWALCNSTRAALVSDSIGTLFETGTTPSNRLRLYFKDSADIWLDYGNESKKVVEASEFRFSAEWHHLALNVVRGQSASFYFDGRRTAVIAEQDMPPVEGSVMTIGKGLCGMIDELRYWRAAITEKRLLANQWNCIDTTDVYSRGLSIYLPFEKGATVDGIRTKVGTLENMAPASPSSVADTASAALQTGSVEAFLVTSSPALKNVPEETRLIASPVASERKVVINLTDVGIRPRDIEGTTLNITVDQIHDLHGNTSLPIRWTAYVQQNTLKWTRDSVNIFKNYGDSYTFDVIIENKSGQTEYYTLYNMPQWLTLVESDLSDNLAPLKTRTLRFRIEPTVAVGNYDVTIGLQGNKGILEPLRIVMKVRGERPDWAVDTRFYQHQMNIIGQIRLNGFIMENEESVVAAFIDGQCRGVASPEKVRGAAYVTLTIFGTEQDPSYDLNKPVTFRIFDASTGTIYSDAVLLSETTADGSSIVLNPLDVTFKQDNLVGSFDHPVFWTKSGKVEQHIPLGEHWNWMSLGITPQSDLPRQVFHDYAHWQMVAKTHDGESGYTNDVEWKGSLRIRPNTMYKVKITRTDNSGELPPMLTVTGQPVVLAETPIELQHEWNWIAYTPIATMTVDEALAGANPQQGDRLKSQTAIAIYGPYGWEGNLKALESGQGYVYYSTATANKQFVYPTVVNARTTAAARAAALSPASRTGHFIPVDWHKYPDNMAMVVELRAGQSVIDTLEVAAFVDGECRATTWADDGLYYLVIPGEGSSQPLQLMTWLDGRQVIIDDTQLYTGDANIGTPWEPYVIDVTNQLSGIIELTVEGSDDTDWWNLQGLKIGRKPTRPGIYIHNGKQVTVKP